MTESISGYQQVYNNITTRIEAASDFLNGYHKLYVAAIDDGTPELIRNSYDDVLNATEILLDLKEERKRIQLQSWGLDPQKRHLRFSTGEREGDSL